MPSGQRCPRSCTNSCPNTLRASRTMGCATTVAPSESAKQYPSTKTTSKFSASAQVPRIMGNNACPIHCAAHPSHARPSTLAKPLSKVSAPTRVAKATCTSSSGASIQQKIVCSIRESLEEAFYELRENSVGFLTPSLSQSHSEGPSWCDGDSLSDKKIRFFCCHLPKIRLPEHRPRPCRRFPRSKDEVTVADSCHPVTHGVVVTRDMFKKSFARTNNGANWPINGIEQVPTTLIDSKSINNGKTLKSLYHKNITTSILPGGCRTPRILSSIKKNHNSQGITGIQVDIPTIVTLRRAVAVLSTLAQSSRNDGNVNVNNVMMLREYRRSIRSLVPPAEYLITFEEISNLKNLIQTRFTKPLPEEKSPVEKEPSSTGLAWNGRVRKATSGSVVWFGAPRKYHKKTALPTSNIYKLSESVQGRGRRGHILTHISQPTSIISMIMTGKSIQEIICDDNIKLQSLISSTSSFANNLTQNDIMTWSIPSFSRIPATASISSIDRSLHGEPLLTWTKIEEVAVVRQRTFKGVLEHPDEKPYETPYDIEKYLALSGVRVLSYVTQHFYICTPEPISEAVCFPPITSSTRPLIDISTIQPKPSLIDSGYLDSIWRQNRAPSNLAGMEVTPKSAMVSVNLQSRPPSPRSYGRPHFAITPTLVAPASILQPKPSPRELSKQCIGRVLLTAQPKASLLSSDIAASGQMTVTHRVKALTATNASRMWKRSSTHRLRNVLETGW